MNSVRSYRDHLLPPMYVCLPPPPVSWGHPRPSTGYGHLPQLDIVVLGRFRPSPGPGKSTPDTPIP